MNKPAALPQYDDLVTFTLRVNGAELASVYSVISVTTHNSWKQAPSATLALFAWDAASESFPVIDAGVLAPGTSVAISAGYHGQEQEIFSGVVETNRLQVEPDGPPVFWVGCRATPTEATIDPVPVLSLAYGVNIFRLNLNEGAPSTADAHISGTVTVPGYAPLLPGQSVQLSGVGSSFSSTLLVTAVEQFIRDGNWQTTITLRSALL